MFEKVNPGHPDKMADRLAGAVVDLVYERSGGLAKANPRVAVEVLAGHGRVDVQIETSLGRRDLKDDDIAPLIYRIFGSNVIYNVLIAPQDAILSDNQTNGLRCGDNGIFKGCPPTEEQRVLTAIAATIYGSIPYDGKYIIGEGKMRVNDKATGKRLPWIPDKDIKTLTICQSHATDDEIKDILNAFAEHHEGNGIPVRMDASPIELAPQHHFLKLPEKYLGNENVGVFINPLGPWTGGIYVDCGCTNRKLGSDMGDGVTGGGLHGKDLSKADVSVNIWCHLEANRRGHPVEAICSIGDDSVNGVPYAEIVEQARSYIQSLGGFEKFAEWGLIRP